jgi:hypothetical protein
VQGPEDGMEDLVGNLTDNSELKKGKQPKGEKAPKGTTMAPRDEEEEEEEGLSDEDPFGMGYDSSGSDSTDDGMTDAR